MKLKAKVKYVYGKARIFMSCPKCSKPIVCDVEILADSATGSQFLECFQCKRKYLFTKQISKLLGNNVSVNLKEDKGNDRNDTGTGTSEL